MRGSSYRERDYAFGQVMLTLRAKLGLTQTELADMLGVTRRAVGDWEGGLTYPKADHLKQFVVLGIRRQAFPAGREIIVWTIKAPSMDAFPLKWVQL